MVASYQGYAVGVADFEAEEEEKGLERVETAVNEVACISLACGQTFCSVGPGITHEKIVCIGYIAAHAK